VEHDFWLERWRDGNIGFHKSTWNPMLEKHWSTLGVAAGSPVFVPLCGKSLDMRSLVSRGHPVIGVDVSELAIESYFAEGGETFERQEQADEGPDEEPESESSSAPSPEGSPRGRSGRLAVYRGPRTTIYAGDVFDVRSRHVENVRAVYDRGALVALPDSMRGPYVAHVLARVPVGTVFLVLALEYDRDRVDGPPFCVPAAAIASMYGPLCEIEELDRVDDKDAPPRFAEAGVLDVVETVYRIVKVADR